MFIAIACGCISLLFWLIGLPGWAHLIPWGMGFILTMFPIEGYEHFEHEIDLIPLKEGIKIDGKKIGSEKYVITDNSYNAIFAYDNRRKYNFDALSYEEARIKGNIKIYKSEECEKPILKVIRDKPNRTMVCLAPFSTKTEYVFLLPTDSTNFANFYYINEKRTTYKQLSQIKKVIKSKENLL